jgi:hypothetical protein
MMEKLFNIEKKSLKINLNYKYNYKGIWMHF